MSLQERFKTWLKEKTIGLLIPTNWVEWLKGKKTVLGAISLVLWALIYALPAIRPDLAEVAQLALKLQAYLTAAGLDVNTFLGAGTGLTVIGLLDKLLAHLPSKAAVAVLSAPKTVVVAATGRTAETK